MQSVVDKAGDWGDTDMDALFELLESGKDLLAYSEEHVEDGYEDGIFGHLGAPQITADALVARVQKSVAEADDAVRPVFSTAIRFMAVEVQIDALNQAKRKEASLEKERVRAEKYKAGREERLREGKHGDYGLASTGGYGVVGSGTVSQDGAGADARCERSE